MNAIKVSQEEMKAALTYNTTLMIENFTEIRKDIRVKHHDVQADVDLLFKEVEGVKRQTYKIEQKLGK